MWTYRCYDDGRSPCLWKRWYDDEGNKVYRGSHDSAFGILEQQTQWREPNAKFFDKDHRIIEVRLSGKVECRILGFYGKSRYEFIVIATCYHKDKVYSPKDIRTIAQQRKAEIESDIGRAPICDRPQ